MLILVSALIIIIAGFLLFLQLHSYDPDDQEPLSQAPLNGDTLTAVELSLLTWNIGYGGLGKEMDFFYEGGTMVRPDRNAFDRYLSGIMEELRKYDSADFIFLQETDRQAKRSYYLDEFKLVQKNLPGYNAWFAKNYDSRYVPVPLTSPMGRVVSGIAAFSKHQPSGILRIDFGTRFSWPKQLVMLQRCFMIMRYPLENGKELVLINTHNSVFDKDAVLRKQELVMLSRVMNLERTRGNYVIAGGDWNVNPPGDNRYWLNSSSGEKMTEMEPRAGKEELEGWQFIYDPAQPTNRYVDGPYVKGKTRTTIIDYFVVSPNILVREIKTIPLAFENSDHNPVWMKVRLVKQ